VTGGVVWQKLGNVSERKRAFAAVVTVKKLLQTKRVRSVRYQLGEWDVGLRVTVFTPGAVIVSFVYMLLYSKKMKYGNVSS
jgi:hypothetical protein